jgi:hypothetical protein
MKQTKLNYFQELPTWAKGVIGIAVVGGVALLAYKSYKWFQDYKESKDAGASVDAAADEFKDLDEKDNLSFNNAAYVSLANDIAIKLNGCEMATTEVAVIIAITRVVKKPIDWYYLVKIFGVRKVDDCGFGETPYSLPELLKDQLDTATEYFNIPLVGSGFTLNSYSILESYLSKIGVRV